MPKGATKEEVQFMLKPDNISVGVRGFAPLLEGQLHDAVDPEASAWIIKDDKRFAPWLQYKAMNINSGESHKHLHLHECVGYVHIPAK